MTSRIYFCLQGLMLWRRTASIPESLGPCGPKLMPCGIFLENPERCYGPSLPPTKTTSNPSKTQPNDFPRFYNESQDKTSPNHGAKTLKTLLSYKHTNHSTSPLFSCINPSHKPFKSQHAHAKGSGKTHI